jgi:hypothetical protein
LQYNWKKFDKQVHPTQNEGEKMSTETNSNSSENQEKDVQTQGGASDAVYGLGLIGAWVYFIGQANTNQERLQGFFKGFVWPAYLVYKLFEYLDKE